MGAPTKPPGRYKSFRGYFYCEPGLAARLQAESLRRGGASISDIVRWSLMKSLPPAASISVDVVNPSDASVFVDEVDRGSSA